jgi:ADP-ribosylglycohydrolase
LTPSVDAVRLSRAHKSLEGLSCGDAFGERFFLPDSVVRSLIELRTLPAAPWFFTDDTMMAVSIVITLAEGGDQLALSFGQMYDSSRGYGLAMNGLLPKLRQRPSSWREHARALFDGDGSFGKGAAMRVAPLGAYFADDIDLLVEQAKLSALVTHCHAEGVAGAIAVALAAGIAAQYTTSATPIGPLEFLERVSDRTPASAVRTGIRRALGLSVETPSRHAVGKRTKSLSTRHGALRAVVSRS